MKVIISYYIDKKNRLFEITKTEDLIQFTLITDLNKQEKIEIGEIINKNTEYEELLSIP